MQYWIFYTGGVGGDGFCNLLEHADGMSPADGKLEWRLHTKEGKNYGNTVKFYSPKWSTNKQAHPFRRPDVIVPIEEIQESYLNIVKQNLNTVIPCHSVVYFQHIESCSYKDIVEKNQIKIHLYSLDFDRVSRDLIMKTGMLVSANGDANKNKYFIQSEIQKYYNSNLFDYQIDIEQVWRDWDYFQNWLTLLGLAMKKDYYNKYISLVNPVSQPGSRMIRGPARLK